MYFEVIENFHLTAGQILELGCLEKKYMGESGIGAYELQPITHYGRLFTLEALPGECSAVTGRAGGELINWETADLKEYDAGEERRITGAAEFIASFADRGKAHLFGFYVIDGIRGSGLSGFFLGCSEKRLMEKYGISSVELTVSAENKRAVSFYVKSGYAVMKEEKQYYGSGEDRLIMAKKLL